MIHPKFETYLVLVVSEGYEKYLCKSLLFTADDILMLISDTTIFLNDIFSNNPRILGRYLLYVYKTAIFERLNLNLVDNEIL